MQFCVVVWLKLLQFDRNNTSLIKLKDDQMKINKYHSLPPKAAPIWPFLILLSMFDMFGVLEVSMYGRQ